MAQIGMKKIGIVISVILFISGCAASSTTVKPTTVPEQTGSVIQEQIVPETAPVMEQPVTDIMPEEAASEIQDVLQAVEPTTSQPIVVTYSQITNLISEFVDIQPVEATSGEPRFLGTSENNLVILELIGNKDNISQASIKLIYPSDIVAVNADLNRAMMLRFLRNAVPEFDDWPARVSGIIDKFYSMEASTGRDSMEFNGKSIDILYDKDSGSITVTVRSG